MKPAFLSVSMLSTNVMFWNSGWFVEVPWPIRATFQCSSNTRVIALVLSSLAQRIRKNNHQFWGSITVANMQKN